MEEQSLEEKLGLLASISKKINAQYGENMMVRPSEAPPDLFAKRVIPTGILNVDKAMLIGGLPRGAVVEIYGTEHACKSLLAYSTIAQAQKLGGACALIDLEWSFEEEWTRKQGVNTDQLYVARPRTAEQALDITLALLRKASMDVIVIDSVAALLPTAEQERSTEDGSLVGAQAKMMSEFMRKVMPDLYDRANYAKSLVIFINQIRDKIGGYMPSTTTPGGKALRFYSKVRIEMRPGEPLKTGDRWYGNEIKGKIVKSKVSSASHSTFSFRMIYGKGIDKMDELITNSIDTGILQVGGGGNHTFMWPGLAEPVKLRGREKVMAHLEENPEFAEQVRTLCYQMNS